MGDRAGYPEKLLKLLADFDWITDRNQRTELLIHYADQFEPVPERIATSPYPEEQRVPACESDAFVWVEQNPDHSLHYYFAVENPQGLSAMAMASILNQTVNDLPPEQIVQIQDDIVLDLFGREISMGKGRGLTGIVSMVRGYAQRYLAQN
jgi:cysteine desulfuration protein SufE